MEEFRRTKQAEGGREPGPEGGAASRKKRSAPPYWRVLRWLLLLALLVPVVYFAVQVVLVLMPRMNTQVAILDEMTDAVPANGFVALESTPVEGTGGVVYYTVPTGQRVSVGAEVAMLFSGNAGAEAMAKLERVDEELALLEEAQATVAEGGDMDAYLRQMEDSLSDYIHVLQTGRYGDIVEPGADMTLAANRLQVVTHDADGFAARIAALQAQREQLMAAAQPTGHIAAPETGYFVPSTGQDQIPKSSAELEGLTPEALSQAMEQPPAYYSQSVAGHVVSDYRWYYYTVLPAKEAAKFAEGMKLEITFPEVGDAVMPVTVETVAYSADESEAKIVLLCEYNNPEILQLRQEQAQIIFSTQKGLRVDKKALRVIDGERCVYVKFGNQVFLKNVQVLVENEQYVLVSDVYEAEVNELQMYDVVVVDSGGEEMYDKKIL